jgi:hypothetical protein
MKHVGLHCMLFDAVPMVSQRTWDALDQDLTPPHHPNRMSQGLNLPLQFIVGKFWKGRVRDRWVNA